MQRNARPTRIAHGPCVPEAEKLCELRWSRRMCLAGFLSRRCLYQNVVAGACPRGVFMYFWLRCKRVSFMYSYDYCSGGRKKSFFSCNELVLQENLQKITLRQGFDLVRQSSNKFEKRIDLVFGQEEFVTISYCISGNIEFCFYDRDQNCFSLELRSGRYAMSYFSELSSLSIKGYKFPLKCVSLCISLSQLKKFICVSPFQRKLQNILSGLQKKDGVVEAFTPLSLDIPLRQILEYPSHLGMLHLFMEYKALEVLYTQLNLIDDTTKEDTHIAPYEYEAAIKAHEVLINNIIEPPSLQAMARQVGMTHTRLNKVFRHIFGNTVFGVLRGERLECARRMLGETRKSVAEVAYACGFSSPSHLSRLFLSAYGVQPKRYQSERSFRGNTR